MNNQNTSRLPEKQREIVHHIIRYIKKNKLKGDSILPSENSLASRFGVNRNVVRTALAHLRSQGYIYSVRGKGFFVAEHSKPLVYEHSATIGFSEIIGKAFTDYENILLSSNKGLAKSVECTKLNLTSEDSVYRLRTLRAIKGVPFAICYSSIPEKLVGDLEESLQDFHSINDILVNRYGYEQPRCTEIIIEASSSNVELLKYFDMPDGVPILSVSCLFATEKTGPIEYFVIKARSDMFKYSMDFKNGI